MKNFNYYEIMGVAVPGAAFVIILAVATSKLPEIVLSKDFGIANLGIFLVIAFVAGQFTQAFGNLLENIYWYFAKGMPSDWIRTGKKTLLSTQQVDCLKNKLKKQQAISGEISELDKEQWYGVTRQIYANVQKDGNTYRIDRFNANYGLNRGLATASIMAVIVILFVDFARWKLSLLCLLVAAVFLYRMQRFGKNYARELFVQYLEVSGNKNREGKT